MNRNEFHGHIQEFVMFCVPTCPPNLPMRHETLAHPILTAWSFPCGRVGNFPTAWKQHQINRNKHLIQAQNILLHMWRWSHHSRLPRLAAGLWSKQHTSTTGENLTTDIHRIFTHFNCDQCLSLSILDAGGRKNSAFSPIRCGIKPNMPDGNTRPWAWRIDHIDTICTHVTPTVSVCNMFEVLRTWSALSMAESLSRRSHPTSGAAERNS